MKNLVLVASLVLNVILFAFLIWNDNSGKDNVDEKSVMETIKQNIIKQERAELPLHIQEFDGVVNIKIDSLVITNNEEPYCGYLVTTWDIDKKDLYSGHAMTERVQKTAYVKVENIYSRGDETSWNAEWLRTYIDIR